MQLDNNFIKSHPNMTLSEYLDYKKSEELAANEREALRVNNHTQWIIDNFANKKSIFRMNGGFYLISFEYDAVKNAINPHVIYSFAQIDIAYLGHPNSKRFRLDNLEVDDKEKFNLNWIKSPFNDNSMVKPAYVMSDEIFEDYINKLKSYENTYKELLDFENNPNIATKIN